MIIELLIITQSISIILIGFLIYRSLKLIKEIRFINNILVSERETVANTLETMLDQMREIDATGAFESDDEVGGIFNQLKDLIEIYVNEI